MRSNSGDRKIILRGWGAISPFGCSSEEELKSISEGKSKIQSCDIEGCELPAAPLAASSELALFALEDEHARYSDLDKTVRMAIYAARQAVKQASWQGASGIVVNIGSSRGATGLFERYLREHDQSASSRVGALASPTTTLGNISSWVLQDLELTGSEFSHSITCSSGLQAVANGVAWLKSGLAKRAVVGASEAPLTRFTVAQMKALKIYALSAQDWPCRPCALEIKAGTGMVLGEGAAVQAYEMGEPSSGDIVIAGIGLASEPINSPTSISECGESLQRAMRTALSMAGSEEIDAIILHAPGTPAGDSAELNAVEELFGSNLPQLISNKWMIGHTLGAAGSLNIQYAINLLRGALPAKLPYAAKLSDLTRPVKKVMVNAAGFGGNAGSVILSLI